MRFEGGDVMLLGTEGGREGGGEGGREGGRERGKERGEEEGEEWERQDGKSDGKCKMTYAIISLPHSPRTRTSITVDVEKG